MLQLPEGKAGESISEIAQKLGQLLESRAQGNRDPLTGISEHASRMDHPLCFYLPVSLCIRLKATVERAGQGWFMCSQLS